MPENNASNFIATFNQQRYFFKVTLSNGDKTTAPLELSYYFIDSLVIEETLNDWYTTGYIILKNDYEMFERGLADATANLAYTTAKTEQKLTSLYTFRNDGRNKINVRIFPLLGEGDSVQIESVSPEVWEINYDFVIYNVEDLPSNDLSEKRKKLYIWEERYQHFLERNIQWSTYYVAAEIANTDKVLADNSCKVGAAIKHLIQTACGETQKSLVNSSPLKVGWLPTDPAGSINTPTLPVATFNEEKWDDGAELNAISYTSPATYNVIDDLTYLLEYYVSGKNTKDAAGLGMPGILRLDRYTKKWELTGIDEIYKASTDGELPGKDLIEQMYIQSTDNTSPIHNVKKTPAITQSNLVQNVNAGMSSVIFSYKFVNMADIHDLYITNRPVINYDFGACQWNVHFKQNTVENVKETLKQELLPKLYGNAKKSGILIGLNKDKLNGLNTSVEHSVIQSGCVSVLPRNNMIYNNVVLNQAVEFTAAGLTIRTPGKFISIDRELGLSPENNAFEDKFIGQWLLTRVVHSFNRDKYLTHSIGVKINSFNELAAFKPENDTFNE